MIGNGKIQYSEETLKIIKEMGKDEFEAFLDLCSVLACAEQIREPGVDLVPVMSRVINDQASKFVLRKTDNQEKRALRAGFEEDMAKRRSATGQFVPRQPTPPPVAEDASTQLERITRSLMETKGLGYGEAFNLAQKERKDLAAKILEQLNEYRAR